MKFCLKPSVLCTFKISVLNYFKSIEWNFADMKHESMWDLHWIKEQWDRFFFDHFPVLLSVLFHQFSLHTLIY